MKSINIKCQPGRELKGLYEYIALNRSRLPPDEITNAANLLARYELDYIQDFDGAPARIQSLIQMSPYVDVFPLNEAMLQYSLRPEIIFLDLKPFDQAILSAVIVRSLEIRSAGEAVVDWESKGVSFTKHFQDERSPQREVLTFDLANCMQLSGYVEGDKTHTLKYSRKLRA